VAISRLLEGSIQIYKNQAGTAVLVPGGNRDPGYESNCQINLGYTSAHKNSGSNNHYHSLIEEGFLKKRLRSESLVSGEEFSSLSSPIPVIRFIHLIFSAHAAPILWCKIR
jgi:hypothetical protein